MTSSRCRFALCISSMAVAGVSAVDASAIGPQVIYTKIRTHGSSIVPGAVDLAGAPVVTNFRALEDIFLSPDGSKWVVRGRTQQGPDSEIIMLMGSGKTGTMFLQEGRPVPGGVAGELIDFFGSGVGRFDDANNFALSLRARGGAASTFQKVITWINGSFALPIRMGDLYTGLVDLLPNPSGDETVGNSIGSIHLLNDGTIGSQDSTILQVHTSRRPAIAYNHAGFQQTGVTTFLSMDGLINFTYGTLSANSFYTVPQGKRWLVQATILGAPATSNDVLVVDGQVELQEDVAVGTSTALVHAIVTADVLSNGDWLSRGTRRVAGVQNGVWAARNGQLIAQSGDPVSPPIGPAENWADTFLALTGNTDGDIILVGRTNNANVAIDDVVSYNGAIVLREGDPIDLDANGLYDDSVFIGRGNNTLSAFEPNDFAISNSGMLYFFPTLRDAAVGGVDLNSNPAFGSSQAFLRMDLTPCPGDITPLPDGDDSVGIGDLLFVIAHWGGGAGDPADVDGDNTVGIADLLFVIAHWGGC